MHLIKCEMSIFFVTEMTEEELHANREERREIARAAKETRLPYQEDDPDEAAARRLKETMGMSIASGGEGATATAGGDDQGGAGGKGKEEEQGQSDGPSPEEWERMSDRDKKLFQLRMKLNKARKDNQKEVIGEKKRQSGKPHGQEGSGKKDDKPAWQKQWEADASKMGLNADKPHLLEPQETAEKRMERQKKKGMHGDASNFSTERAYREYEKRAERLELDRDVYEQKKREHPEYFTEEAVIDYGSAPPDDEARMDKMVEELRTRDKKALQNARKKHKPSKEIDAINTVNESFNKSIDKSFGKHTQEIRRNLERGTALPDH